MEAVHEQSVSVTPHIARATQVMADMEMFTFPRPPIYTRVVVVTKPQRLDVTAFPRPAEPPSSRLTPDSIRVPGSLRRLG